MDIDSARKNLVISGYEHPSSVITNRDRRYKTFDETDTKKKKNMDRFQGTNVGNQYATIVMTQEDLDNCPTCGEIPTSTCPCAYSDKTCVNNHIWYTDREGKSIIGNPHVTT